MVLAADNRQRLKQSGRVSLLTADHADNPLRRIASDLEHGSGRRPVLSVGGLAEIEQLLTDREALVLRLC